MAAKIDQKYKDGYVRFNLNNVEVWWAHVHSPDTAFGNNKYCLEMHLTDKVASQLQAEGFSIADKTLKDGTVVKNVLKAKREKVLKSGKVQDPPLVVGADAKTPFTEEIGNGSICNLQLSAHAWNIRGGWQLTCYLEGVQVVKHVPYNSNSGFSDVTAEDEIPF